MTTAMPQGALIETSDISLELAEALVSQVKKECDSRGLSLSVAVVDRGGNLVAASRMDGAQLGALSLATNKAYTAVAFGFPTSMWVDSSAPGGSDWGLTNAFGGKAIVFPGGLPLFAGGQLIGGIGVSGAASSVDEECAQTAVTACGLGTAQ